MILLDYSQIVKSCVYAETKGKEDLTIDDDYLRHMIINSIRSYNVMFRKKYGQMVIAVDSKNYWRYDLHPNYKGTRKEKKDKEKIDWDNVSKVMLEVVNEMDQFLPFIVIKVNRCEADDIIGVLCEHSKTMVGDGLFDDSPEIVKIIGGDGDYIQTHTKEISQHNPITEMAVKAKVSPKFDLNMKIICGDVGDCITNIKSDRDDLFNHIRQKAIKQTEKDMWAADPSSIPDEFKAKFEENKKLVSFNEIPSNYRDQIIAQYEHKSKNPSDPTLVYKYFLEKGLTRMMMEISDFT